MGRAVALAQEASEQRGPGITGPFSVEVPSGDGKLIRIAAVEAAMPQLLARETFTVEHEESAVGKILPLMPIDWGRVPNDPVLRAMVKEFEASHGGLPTGIVTVTPAVAAAFPRLQSMLGERVAWVSGYIHGDNRIAHKVAQRVRDGSLNSFSLNGVKFTTRRMQWCDPRGCRIVEEVPQGGLDLETVTLCSDRGEQGVFGATTAQNPGAALAVIQQAQRSRQGPIPGSPYDVAALVAALRREREQYLAVDVDATVADVAAVEGAARSLETLGDVLFASLRRQLGADVPEAVVSDIASRASEDAFRAALRQARRRPKRARAAGAPADVCGVPVVVEHPKGATRRGVNSRGEAWERVLLNAYGHIARTNGADGEAVDAWVADYAGGAVQCGGPAAAVVIDQVDQDSGAFDEHKVMLGFASEEEALDAYRRNYPDGWRVGPHRAMSIPEFQAWLKDGDTTMPATERVIISHGSGNGSGTVHQGDEARLAQGGCAARAVLDALSLGGVTAKAAAAAAASKPRIAEALAQAAEGWLGQDHRAYARRVLKADDAWMRHALRARGLSFPDFDTCKAWAERNGLNDPGAFCGALEKETHEAGPAQEARTADAELQQASEATGVPAPVLQWLLQGDEFPGGFEGCVERMRKRGGVKDPEALCAFIGRRAGKIPAAAREAGENRNRQDANGPSVAEAQGMTPAAAQQAKAEKQAAPPAPAAPVKQDDPAAPAGGAPANLQELVVEIMRRLEALEAKAGMGAAPAGEAQAGADKAPAAPPAQSAPASPAQQAAAPAAPAAPAAAPSIDPKALLAEAAQAFAAQVDQRVEAVLAQAGITVPKPAAVPQARVRQAQGGSTPVPAAPGGDGHGADLDGELERLQRAADRGDAAAFKRGLQLAGGGA